MSASRRVRIVALLLEVVLAACAQTPLPTASRDIALSFDDGFDPREQPEAAAWNTAMLETLSYAEVRAILFPAGKRVDTPEGMVMVAAWGDSSHAIGNHTYAHASLASADTKVDAFVSDVERDDALLHSMPGFTRRLRFPYLKEGDDETKRDAIRDWLAAHSYRSGAVTVDTSAWYYDVRYRAWLAAHPGGDPAPIRNAYLAHLADRIVYYDGLSQRVLHRSVKHVMLLHTNAINAAFLPDIIEMMRANGWTIVRPGEAYADPVYAMRPSTLPAGESLLWSLAKEAGARDLRYPAEDDVYEKTVLDRLGL